MDINKLTQKSQEALQAAQTKALRYGHQEVDAEHLLLALLEQPEGLVPRLLNRMDVSSEKLKGELEQELSRRPKVSGPGAEAGKIYLTQRLQQVFVRAEDEAKRLKDEYVSVEHLLTRADRRAGEPQRDESWPRTTSPATPCSRRSPPSAATSG